MELTITCKPENTGEGEETFNYSLEDYTESMLQDEIISDLKATGIIVGEWDDWCFELSSVDLNRSTDSGEYEYLSIPLTVEVDEYIGVDLFRLGWLCDLAELLENDRDSELYSAYFGVDKPKLGDNLSRWRRKAEDRLAAVSDENLIDDYLSIASVEGLRCYIDTDRLLADIRSGYQEFNGYYFSND